MHEDLAAWKRYLETPEVKLAKDNDAKSHLETT